MIRSVAIADLAASLGMGSGGAVRLLVIGEVRTSDQGDLGWVGQRVVEVASDHDGALVGPSRGGPACKRSSTN